MGQSLHKGTEYRVLRNPAPAAEAQTQRGLVCSRTPLTGRWPKLIKTALGPVPPTPLKPNAHGILFAEILCSFCAFLKSHLALNALTLVPNESGGIVFWGSGLLRMALAAFPNWHRMSGRGRFLLHGGQCQSKHGLLPRFWDHARTQAPGQRRVSCQVL